MKVKIQFTVEVDQEAYADYYGLPNTAASVRADVQSLLGGDGIASMAPHLFDAEVLR